MYNSILVPLDGSSFAEHALPAAAAIARQNGATITLLKVHVPLKAVYTEGVLFFDKEMDEHYKAQDQAYLNLIVKRLQSKWPEMKVATQLMQGDIAAAIAEEAESNAFDLIVMTTHGRGAWRRFWLGSVTDQLIRRASKPLLLVPAREGDVDYSQEVAFNKILIPLDGSELAEQILEPAVALGKAWNAGYLLVRIIKPLTLGDYPPEVASAVYNVEVVLERVEKIQQELREQSKTYLEGIAHRLRSQKLEVQTLLDEDIQPAATILRDAEKQGVSLIALETHARHGLPRLFLGSVADKVIRAATVPVLLHRPGHH